jgi:hypothetical protein
MLLYCIDKVKGGVYSEIGLHTFGRGMAKVVDVTVLLLNLGVRSPEPVPPCCVLVEYLLLRSAPLAPFPCSTPFTSPSLLPPCIPCFLLPSLHGPYPHLLQICIAYVVIIPTLLEDFLKNIMGVGMPWCSRPVVVTAFSVLILFPLSSASKLDFLRFTSLFGNLFVVALVAMLTVLGIMSISDESKIPNPHHKPVAAVQAWPSGDRAVLDVFQSVPICE